MGRGGVGRGAARRGWVYTQEPFKLTWPGMWSLSNARTITTLGALVRIRRNPEGGATLPVFPAITKALVLTHAH